MTVGYEEFRSYTLDAIHNVVADALKDAETLPITADMDDPYDLLRLVEQMCTESRLAFEDGSRLEDTDVQALVDAYYGEHRQLTWTR